MFSKNELDEKQERKAKKMITKDMSITEIVEEYPDSAEILFAHGMHCLGCMAAQFENLEQAAAAHGIDIDALVNDLNKNVGGDAAKESK